MIFLLQISDVNLVRFIYNECAIWFAFATTIRGQKFGDPGHKTIFL